MPDKEKMFNDTKALYGARVYLLARDDRPAHGGSSALLLLGRHPAQPEPVSRGGSVILGSPDFLLREPRWEVTATDG